MSFDQNGATSLREKKRPEGPSFWKKPYYFSLLCVDAKWAFAEAYADKCDMRTNRAG